MKTFPMSLFALSLIGYYLNIEKNWLCWPVWILANAGWFFLNWFVYKAREQAVLLAFYLAIAVWGLFAWK